MILHLADETTKEICFGSALAGHACNAIEIEWQELDRALAVEGTKRTIEYLNLVLRTKLLPGAELRIVQEYTHEKREWCG